MSTSHRIAATGAPRLRPRILSALFVVGMMLVAVWAAWPIYQNLEYLVMAGGALFAGLVLAALAVRYGWSWFTVLLALLATYLVLGVPLAVPTALTGGPAVLNGLLDLVTATVFSWKELVTISLPVGSYQTLLVPAFVLFLVGSTVAFALVWRGGRRTALVVPVMFIVQLFGLVCGSSALSPPTVFLGLSIAAPRESVIGLAALLLAFGFLSWRTQLARAEALALATRVRRVPGGRARRLRRAALATGVLVVAIAVSLGGLSLSSATPLREVLRSSIDPAVELREYVSPLSHYRNYFSAENYNTELFSVTGDAGATGATTRLRLAVLSYYDGQTFQAVDPAAGTDNQATAFARMPQVSGSMPGSETTTLTVADYTGVWMPAPGEVTSIRFAGDRAGALRDGFFYNAGTASAVQLGGFAPGDRYTVVSPRPGPTPALADLGQPVSRAVDDTFIPDSLVAWTEAQAVTRDGAGLAELVTRLRERGYLSHALTTPALNSWTADLGNYQFSPSLSGHSVARIDALFTALLTKQNSTTSTRNSQLVAAIGDDEQFAVAAALLARHLGFESRIVVGFNPGGEAAANAPGLCPQGVCSAKNIAAWVEVAAGNNEWVSVDASPQFANVRSPIDTTTRDPQYNTEVIAEGAIEQRAPEANPTNGNDQQPPEPPRDAGDAWLLPVFVGAGASLAGLLILSLPFLAIIAAKVRRRRERAGALDVRTRFAGGWSEYVDAAVDRGWDSPGSKTRLETAQYYQTPGGARLAALADRATFGDSSPQTADSDAFWALVAAERAALAASGTRRQRWRAALSLRSFSRLTQARSSIFRRRRSSTDDVITVPDRARDQQNGGAAASQRPRHING